MSSHLSTTYPSKSKTPSPTRHTSSPSSSSQPFELTPVPLHDPNSILDENDDDDDDEFLPTTFSTTASLSTTSLSPSILAHAYDPATPGRTYHAYKNGRYPIPNDSLEQHREDMKHAMLLELLDGKLFLAPIDPNPQRIIDIGTGTGIWAVEMGDLYPGAEVLGLDLSPHQTGWVPGNVRFVVDDVEEEEWANGGGWEFAHLRGMALCFRDLGGVVGRVFRHLKPGGWIEFQESHGVALCDDGTMSETDDVLRQFYDLCVQALGKFGMDLNVVDKVGDYLAQTGFTNITCVRKKIPVGTWPKDPTMRLIGLYVRETAEHSLPSLAKAFANLGMSEIEREVWSAKVREALRDNRVHRYYYYYFWYAQKPE